MSDGLYSDGPLGKPALDAHLIAYGGPHDGGELGRVDGNTVLFPLQTPPDSNAGLVHVYQWRAHPVRVEDAWVYMGVRAREEVGT